MGIKGSRDRTNDKKKYDKNWLGIKWKEPEHAICPKCCGELNERLVEDEVYRICRECGSVI